MSNIAYIRVNTKGEEIPQIAALKPFNIDKWFIEKISGKNTDHPKFKEMMNYIRKGNTIYIAPIFKLFHGYCKL